MRAESRGSRRRTAGVGGWVLLLCLLLASCVGSPSSPSPTPSAHPTPTLPSTSTAAPTPAPPVPLKIDWPGTISALEDVTVRVQLPGLAERDPGARVRAFVRDPSPRVWWQSDLEPVGNGTYAALVPLHLPLESPPGEWELVVVVLTAVPVSGESVIPFRPEPVPLWDLQGQVRAGVILRVPQALAPAWNEGDQVAGRRIWRGAKGQVVLAWAPGPDEPLTRDTAQVMVESTYLTRWPVEILSVELTEWQGMRAFSFTERWTQGPAHVLVVQGPDLWLYLLRVRALDGEAISPLLRDIQATFQVGEPE